MPSSHPAPPDVLDTPLELTPADWERRQVYHLLTGLVVPRPIAWLSTVDDRGVRNLAPHSYFNLVATDPPHVMFASTGVKDTLRNIRVNGEFVVNLVSQHVVEEMNATSGDLPPEEDEFDWFGIEATPSAVVAPPRVTAARAHLECRAVHEVPIGASHVVFGEILHVHISPDIWSAGRVDPEHYDPVCRLAGTGYAQLGEVFKLPRPTWDELRTQPAGERIPRR